MKLTTLRGLIRRRILVNFRVDPKLMQSQLPAPFQPKLHQGMAVAGICLIRLEQIRPSFLPMSVGISSENAAHRVAVTWEQGDVKKEGVFICRRDTNSYFNHLAGGRLFPGEHHRAQFDVHEYDNEIRLKMKSEDRKTSIHVRGKISDHLPSTSCFSSITEASSFLKPVLWVILSHEIHGNWMEFL